MAAPTEEQRAMMAKLVGDLCQHLIAIGLYHRLRVPDGEQPKEWSLAICSGIVMDTGDDWFVATSGHNFDEFLQLYADPRYEVGVCYLADSFGNQAVFNDHHRLSLIEREIKTIDVVGFDIGLMKLNRIEIEAMRKNGIEAMPESVWRDAKIPPGAKYLLVGTPHSALVNKNEGKQVVPVLVSISLTDDCDPNSSEPTWLEYHVEGETMRDIAGMSGCPVFAVSERRYWIVGLQSRWDPDTRWAKGVRTKVFGPMVFASAAPDDP